MIYPRLFIAWLMGHGLYQKVINQSDHSIMTSTLFQGRRSISQSWERAVVLIKAYFGHPFTWKFERFCWVTLHNNLYFITCAMRSILGLRTDAYKTGKMLSLLHSSTKSNQPIDSVNINNHDSCSVGHTLAQSTSRLYSSAGSTQMGSTNMMTTLVRICPNLFQMPGNGDMQIMLRSSSSSYKVHPSMWSKVVLGYSRTWV